MKLLLVIACLDVTALSVCADELLKNPAPAATRPAATQPIPPALTHYMGREIAQTMHFAGAPWLTRESRDREEEPAKLMNALGLKKGMTVCDLGCGNGFYTLKLAQAVGPEGKVYAQDIQSEMLDLLKDRVEKSELKTVEPVLGTVADTCLPEGKMDLILLVDVYHEIDRPVQMLASIRKSLADKGRLVLVEFRAEDPKVPIKKLHKMSKAQIRKELSANGFKVVEEFDGLPWQHVMFFEKGP